MDHLESMRVFVKVAETASFSRAADSLDVSASAITRLVAALEKRLGARLFQRTTRSVLLTEAGQTFLDRARRIIEDVEDAENIISAQQQAPGGILRIASPVAFGLRHLSLLLKNFTDIYPLVVPHVTLSDDAVNLVEQRFDVAIVPDGDNYSSTLIMRHFVSSPLLLVAAPAYVARHGLPRAPTDLERHVLLSHVEDELGVGLDFLEQIADVILRPETQIVANNVEMIYRLALDGHGIAALPEYLVEADIDSGVLVGLLPMVQLPLLNLNIAFASRKNLPTKVRAFVDFIVDHFGMTGIKRALGKDALATEVGCR
jgi:LysR family transcriptional regulator, transcriptional activator for dmlA